MARETPLQVAMDAMREALRVSREAGRSLTLAEGHALLKLEVELVQAGPGRAADDWAAHGGGGLRMLKCRWCVWQTKRWHTLKDGTRRHGHSRLDRHVWDVHGAEYEAMESQAQADWGSAPDTLEER